MENTPLFIFNHHPSITPQYSIINNLTGDKHESRYDK